MSSLTNNDRIAKPASPVSTRLRGIHEAGAGRYANAAALLTDALDSEPKRTEWYSDLGMVYFAQQNWDSARCAFHNAIEASPDDFRACCGLGRIFLQNGECAEAIPWLSKSVLLRPDSVVALNALGCAMAAEERFDEAAEFLNRALSVSPSHVPSHRALGRLYLLCGEDVLARASWEHALELAPGDAEASEGMVRACWELGDLRTTIEHGRFLIESGLATSKLKCFWLYLLLYDDRETASTIRSECEKFGRGIGPEREQSWPRALPQDSDRKLRVGYLSGEFRDGAAWHFLAPLISNHDTSQFEVFLYHTRNRFDSKTAWYVEAGHWRDCRNLSDDQICELVRLDEIDILVDVSGFFPENRLELFARRAAPLQISYPNCPVTTGVSAMDCIMTDRQTCPSGQESQYTERPVFIPSGYLAYRPLQQAPALTALPDLQNGFLTFGLFQRRAKQNGRFWDAASEILRRTPASRLLIQNECSMLDDPESLTRREIVAEFSKRGVTDNRLTIMGRRLQTEVLTCMSTVDIALDTFPYQGQTTTCECLYMGVPVVALSGDKHVARVGTAILQRVGLGCLTSSTVEEYVNTVVGLASDIPALVELRAGMRERVLHSGLCDERRLTKEVEHLWRELWRERCGSQTNSDF